MPKKTKTETQLANVPTQTQVKTVVEPSQEYAEGLLAILPKFEITSLKKFDKANAVLLETKRLHNELEAQRTSATKPLLATKRTIDSWFAPTLKMLSEVETTLKERIGGYLRDQERSRLDAMAAGEHDAAMAAEAPPLPAGVSARKKNYTRLIDISQVPKEYLLPPQVDWDAVAAAHKRGETVPGIELDVNYSIAVRA